MKIVLMVAGILLLLAGLIWLVYILGSVFSQAEGFTSFSGLWGPMAFHAVCTGLGVGLLGRAVSLKAVAQRW